MGKLVVTQLYTDRNPAFVHTTRALGGKKESCFIRHSPHSHKRLYSLTHRITVLYRLLGALLQYRENYTPLSASYLYVLRESENILSNCKVAEGEKMHKALKLRFFCTFKCMQIVEFDQLYLSANLKTKIILLMAVCIILRYPVCVFLI